jgi:hypothetical protein
VKAALLSFLKNLVSKFQIQKSTIRAGWSQKVSRPSSPHCSDGETEAIEWKHLV